MLKRLFPITLLMLIATVGFSQDPRPVKINPASFNHSPNSPLACAGAQEAGTVSLGPFNGSSNDVDFDTMYLCFNDQILIDSDINSVNLSEDPVDSSPPGIGYAVYDDPPTPGDNGDLMSIQGDQNLTTFPPPPPPSVLPYIATPPNTSGDLVFFNDGDIQNYFNAGMPVLKWFAPITYDSLDVIAGIGFAHFEGVPTGNCVDVNGDAAFAVVFLNEITVSNIQTTNVANGSTCQGSFVLEGGLPEFESNEIYDISITLNGNPVITGTTSGPAPQDGTTVEFQVFEPGIYDVAVTDGKSCPINFQVDMSACSAVGTTISNEVGTPGTEVCVPFTVSNFNDIKSFQYTINWDASVVDFSSFNFVSISSNDLTVSDLGDQLGLSFFFDFTGNLGLTLPDDAIAFEVCFNLIGPVGSSSPVTIDGSSTSIDVFNAAGTPLGLSPTNGSVTVVNQGAFDILVEGNDVQCFGDINGSFDVTVNGSGDGIAPYNITWEEVGNAANNGTLGPIGANGTDSQMGLQPGTYALVISDSDVPSVTDLDTVIIEEPLILGASIAETQPILCFGDTNGSFTANVIVGGVILANPGPEYTFLWSPGNVTTQTIDNVNPSLGTYSVTITDENMCTAVASTTPSQPSELTIMSLDVTNTACSGINTGEIEANAIGGVAPMGYSYEWSTDPVQNTMTATNLAAGAYTVTITDGNMCTVTGSTVVQSATEIFSGATINNVTCNGQDDGSISFTPQVLGIDNGGYTYQWANGISTTSIGSPLAPGSYTTTITDALGCNIDTTIVISEPDAIQIVGDVVTTDETCAVMGDDGTATVTVMGGTPSVLDGYTFSWNCCPTEMTNSATGISSGNYTITVLDSLGCSTFAPFVINPPTPPTIVSFDSISVNCPTDTNGELTVNATEGNAAITGYSWEFPDGSTTSGQTISNIGPGTYTVTVSAADGCEVTGSAFLFAPAPLMISAGAGTMNPTCFGEDDGTATVAVTGGTMPYAYQWSANANSSTSDVVPGLTSGTYTVTVTDANNCGQQVINVTLTDPEEITVVFDNISPVSCFGETIDCDGGATALASGGNSPSAIYTFSWSSGEITMGMSGVASQLCQGTQTVTVTDENNCFAIVTVDIPTPPALSILPTYTEPLCEGDPNGSIEAVGTGGTPGYDIEWEDGSTNPILSGITAGSYDVTITDFNLCEFDTTFILGEPNLLVASIDSIEDVSCSDETDGFIQVAQIGGTPPYSYNWSGNVAPSESNSASNLPSGTYTVTVSDFNGCSSILEQFIDVPTPVFGNIPTPQPPICNGDQTLVTVDAAFGGAGGPYTFSIDDGPSQNIGTLISVFAGDHTIVIEDGNGCTFIQEINIPEPPAIIVNLGPDIEIQLGESTQLNAILSGSNVPIDSIIWTPAIFDSTSCTNCLTPIISPLDDQLYTVEVFDINGCNGSDEIFVEVDKNRNVFIPNVFTPNGDGFNDIFQVFSGPGVTEINSVQIFDRWGELVFQTENVVPTPFEDYDNGWDGKFRGRTMNPGVFVYLVEVTFDDGISLLYRGDVTLLH